MVPPDLQDQALRNFDEKVYETFCSSTGLRPDSGQWGQATLGYKNAGLGLRSTEQHAPAAYLASAGGSYGCCARLDATYATDWGHATAAPDRALARLNSHLPAEEQFTLEAALKAGQRTLSQALDKVAFQTRHTASSMVDRATLISECQPGAYGFLQAVPSTTLGLTFEPALFVEELQSRLCMSVLSDDRWCPLCDAVLDTRGLHARMCACGGDRVVRHNKTRNEVCRRAATAGLNPELEKAGLLLPARPDSSTTTLRRPADVYLPTWSFGTPAALDFAVTAPQRLENLDQAATQPLAAAVAYEQLKKTHLGTEAACLANGIQFIPMVAESTGAWAPTAAKVLRRIAHGAATSTGRSADDIHSEMLQSLSVTIRRANARAVLKRLPDCQSAHTAAVDSARIALQAAAAEA